MSDIVQNGRWRCERFSGEKIGACFRHGRRARSRYLQDRACCPCIAHNALENCAADSTYREPFVYLLVIAALSSAIATFCATLLFF